VCARCGKLGDDCYRLGDVDNDDVIDIADALQILRHVVGLSNEIAGNPRAWCASLVTAPLPLTGDETPQIADALQILRFVVGLSSEFDKSEE